MRRKLTWKFEFLWFDFWIGIYYDIKRQVLFFCPLPCCVFSFRLSPSPGQPRCQTCKDVGVKVAFDTGDGWGLGWDCECGELQDQMIDWPFGQRTVSVKEMEAHGFKVI